MSNALTHLVCHVIFATKNREPLPTTDVRPPLYEYLGGVLRRELATPLAIGGVDDHVHLLAIFPATKSLSKVVGKLKGSSSRWLKQQVWFDRAFAWQRGYAAFSVSQSMEQTVLSYIQNQPQHHQDMEFESELTILLAKHGIKPPPSGGKGI